MFWRDLIQAELKWQAESKLSVFTAFRDSPNFSLVVLPGLCFVTSHPHLAVAFRRAASHSWVDWPEVLSHPRMQLRVTFWTCRV